MSGTQGSQSTKPAETVYTPNLSKNKYGKQDPTLYENVFNETVQTTAPLYANLKKPDPVYQNFNKRRANSGQQITYIPQKQTQIPPPKYVNMSGKQEVQSTQLTEPEYDVADRGNIKAKYVNLSGLSPTPPTRPLSAMVTQTPQQARQNVLIRSQTELRAITTQRKATNVPSPRETLLTNRIEKILKQQLAIQNTEKNKQKTQKKKTIVFPEHNFINESTM